MLIHAQHSLHHGTLVRSTALKSGSCKLPLHHASADVRVRIRHCALTIARRLDISAATGRWHSRRSQVDRRGCPHMPQETVRAWQAAWHARKAPSAARSHAREFATGGVKCAPSAPEITWRSAIYTWTDVDIGRTSRWWLCSGCRDGHNDARSPLANALPLAGGHPRQASGAQSLPTRAARANDRKTDDWPRPIVTNRASRPCRGSPWPC